MISNNRLLNIAAVMQIKKVQLTRLQQQQRRGQSNKKKFSLSDELHPWFHRIQESAVWFIGLVRCTGDFVA